MRPPGKFSAFATPLKAIRHSRRFIPEDVLPHNNFAGMNTVFFLWIECHAPNNFERVSRGKPGVPIGGGP
jgi:hypothetical protein